MVHLVITRCAGASVAPQLVAELVQASIFVLISSSRRRKLYARQAALCLAEGASCPELLHVLDALHKLPAAAAFATL